MTVDPNKLKAELERILAPKLALAAREAAAAMREEISAGVRGGVHYPTQPRRSSAKGEPPQRQSGALVASVAHERVGVLEYRFGYLNNPPPYAFWLEFRPSSNPKLPGNGLRPYIGQLINRPDFIARIQKALQ